MRVTKSGGAQGSFSCSPRGSSRWQGVGSGCPPWSIASVRYCQVEGFKADLTPRYGRRRILEPHDIGPRFANLTVPSGLKEGFVSSGPYRFTRNPQYLGDMILFIGLSVIVNSLYVRIIHALMILVFAIAPLAEETWLEDQYGEVYREYKRATSRFL